MITFEEIDSLKPLAESRGYSVSTLIVGGKKGVGFDRQTPTRDRREFFDLELATVFLRSRPELPRFRVHASYTNGHSELFDFYEVDRRAAMIRGATDADILGSLRDVENPWHIKFLEIL